MPRNARRTPSLPATSPGQPYGVAGEQQAAMAQIPIPVSAPTPVVRPATPPPELAPGVNPDGAGAPAPGAPVEGADRMWGALQAALSSPAPEGDLFADGTQRPHEPLTTMPPASAPQPPRSPTADVLSMVAQAFGGDPRLTEIADAARTKGL